MFVVCVSSQMRINNSDAIDVRRWKRNEISVRPLVGLLMNLRVTFELDLLMESLDQSGRHLEGEMESSEHNDGSTSIIYSSGADKVDRNAPGIQTGTLSR